MAEDDRQSASHPSKRQRVSKACEQCRRKKVKCDGGIPQCSNCRGQKLECKYNETTKKRGPPKGYIEAIEGRMQRLEALLSSVVQEDDPRSQAIMEELNAPLHTPYGELVRPKLLGRSQADDASPIATTNTAASTSSQQGSPSSSIASNSNSQQMPIRPPLPQPETCVIENPDNLGSQYTDENGPVRYYGKASGYYMLRDSKNYKQGVFRFNSSAYRSNKTSSLPYTVDAFALPPKDLSDHLIDLYFKHFYPLLPIMHKRTFMESYQGINPNLPSIPLLLLNSIFALSARISPDIRVRADPSQPDTAGDVFFERARLLLDNEWEDFTVSTVQSLILLSSHQTGLMNTVRGWLYSGLAFRMMQNLGMNRNCDKWNMTEIERENRKRCFFCCFVVDRLSCAMFGRTPIIDERDYDTPFPTDKDEDDPSIIENFHQLIKLSGTLGSVLRQFYTVYGRHQLSVMSTPDRVISVLDKELNGWMAKLPLEILYRPPNTRAGERAEAPSIERCQMHMLFYTTLILLHRLFIPGRCQSVKPSVFPANAICTYAANKILDISVCLMEEDRLQHINCYALYFMFTAGTIFINDAQSPDEMAAFEAKINVNKIMRAMEHVESVWKTSARHSNILGELAGLRDINLEECATYQQQQQLIQQQSPSSSSAAIAVPSSPPMYPAEPPQQQQQQPQQQQQQQQAYAQTRSQPVFDYANPGVNPYDPTAESPPDGQPFDPISMAFWSVPGSFDLNEWNSYLNSSSQQQQEQQQAQ